MNKIILLILFIVFLIVVLPFYKWFREPHKWVMFLVIIYAYFWAYWIQYIKNF